MKPVFQAKLSGRSDCLRASLASIFELNIQSVPAFEEMAGISWKKALSEWLYEKGFLIAIGDHPLDNSFYIGITQFECGLTHASVFQNGREVHNPQPLPENHQYVEGTLKTVWQIFKAT